MFVGLDECNNKNFILTETLALTYYHLYKSPCSECAALLLNPSADFTLLLPPTLPIRHLVLTGTVNGFIKAPLKLTACCT